MGMMHIGVVKAMFEAGVLPRVISGASAGSIVASEGDESAFAAPTEMAGQRIGEIPGSQTEVEATNSDADESFQAAESEADETGLDPDKDDFDDAESSDGLEAAEEGEDKSSTKSRRTRKTVRKLFVWLPLTFPEVPKKGAFDVRRLRQSRYFFH